MNIDKKWLNKYLSEALNANYEIDKFMKTRAKDENIEPGYHIIYTAPESGEQSILTKKSLGENLQQAKEGLDTWLAINPIPKKSAPSKPSVEKTPEAKKVETKEGLDTKLAVNPIPKKSAPSKPSVEKMLENLNKKQRCYLRIKMALEFLCATYPKCFVPYKSREPVRALAIGLGKTLLEAVGDRLPEGLEQRGIKDALRIYCNSFKYNAAKKREGNPRINLEGEVVGKVTKEEVELFLQTRRKPGKFVQKKVPVVVVSKNSNLRKSGAVMPNKKSTRIKVQSLKVTLPLKSEQVPRDILPKEGTPGAAKMKVFWDVVLVGQQEEIFRVGFSVKNYRKCLKTLEQHEAGGSECVILLQGKLVNGGLIEDGGLSVQVKKPKG